MSNQHDITEVDCALVGAGIMSTTLGVFLKELAPNLTIELLESLEHEALESSNSWNNAGTGHAANCELNYTPFSKYVMSNNYFTILLYNFVSCVNIILL